MTIVAMIVGSVLTLLAIEIVRWILRPEAKRIRKLKKIGGRSD